MGYHYKPNRSTHTLRPEGNNPPQPLTNTDGGGGVAMDKSAPEPAPAAAAEEVAARFRSLVDPDDVASIRQTQHLILGRLQDSNAVLTHFNEYSEQCFAEVSSDFASKTRLLKSMKADLEHIFTKLRGMKARLAATYPDAFPDGAMSKTMDQRPDLESPLD